jgi:hypothetical protein
LGGGVSGAPPPPPAPQRTPSSGRSAAAPPMIRARFSGAKNFSADTLPAKVSKKRSVCSWSRRSAPKSCCCSGDGGSSRANWTVLSKPAAESALRALLVIPQGRRRARRSPRARRARHGPAARRRGRRRRCRGQGSDPCGSRRLRPAPSVAVGAAAVVRELLRAAEGLAARAAADPLGETGRQLERAHEVPLDVPSGPRRRRRSARARS